MKKTLFAAVALLAVAAQADYMYWMVDSSNVSGDYTWDTAKLIQDSTAIGTLSKDDADFSPIAVKAGESVSVKITANIYADSVTTGGNLEYKVEIS